MELKTILELPECKVLVEGKPERSISKVFCCDLLSIAMGKAPSDSVWVTVMGNKNTLAVASLADVACIVLAEGVSLDEGTLKRRRRKASPSLPQTFRSSTSHLTSMRQGLHDRALL